MPLADRDTIVQYCTAYLKTASFKDYCVNGLQVEGSKTVRRIVSGVSFSMELIQAAIRRKADMLLVHHGIFSGDMPALPHIGGVLRERLKLLLRHDLNLCGFHLPLDAHPAIGNNISLCKVLGIRRPQPFDIGFAGEPPAGTTLAILVDRIERKLDTQAVVIAAGPAKIKKAAVISGGASDQFAAAIGAGADTFICGDLREGVVRAVEESGINLINAGHYNTEKLGVQNLGKLLSKKFRIPVDFVDIPCAV